LPLFFPIPPTYTLGIWYSHLASGSDSPQKLKPLLVGLPCNAVSRSAHSQAPVLNTAFGSHVLPFFLGIFRATYTHQTTEQFFSFLAAFWISDEY